MNTDHVPVECGDCGLALTPNLEDPGARSLCSRCGSRKRRYHAKASNLQISNYTLDNYIAHRLSELTSCDAPELQSAPNWLNEFLLNSILCLRLPPKNRAYFFNFLRRTEAASAAYREARRQLLESLDTPNNSISAHFLALAQFEVCVSQCYQGYELLARSAETKLYNPGDGSVEERLHTVYVDSKHMDRMIDGEKLPKAAISAVWITNSSLESSRGKITFQELHDLIRGMHECAEVLCRRQPVAQKRLGSGDST